MSVSGMQVSPSPSRLQHQAAFASSSMVQSAMEDVKICFLLCERVTAEHMEDKAVTWMIDFSVRF